MSVITLKILHVEFPDASSNKFGIIICDIISKTGGKNISVEMVKIIFMMGIMDLCTFSPKSSNFFVS